MKNSSVQAVHFHLFILFVKNIFRICSSCLLFSRHQESALNQKSPSSESLHFRRGDKQIVWEQDRARLHSISPIICSMSHFNKDKIGIHLTNHRYPNTACLVGSVSFFLVGNGGGAQTMAL